MNVMADLSVEADFSRSIFLVVDDKPFFRDMAQTALMRCHAQNVKHAVDADEAVELLKRYGPRVGGVVCDWDMRPVSGIELLRKIRTGGVPRTSPELCVVILTGKPDTAAVKSAVLLDVNGFAVAPLSTEKLIKTLVNGVNRTWTARTKSHYLAVPAVEVTEAAPEKAPSTVNARELWRHDEAKRPAEGAAAGPAPRKGPELLNVRMCTLDNVQAGVVLAKDLKDKDGQLLLKSGTDLGARLLERIRGVAHGHAESYHLWVGERPKAVG
jgi:two-component system chemotaxis response regulator CheY